MLTLIPNEHLSDGELIRFLDGEAAPDEREHADAHLAGCAACRERLDGWGRRSIRLSGMLLVTDVPVPATPPRIARPVPWLRAAAMIVVLVGAAALASPVRAWVAQWIGQWTEQAAPERPAVAVGTRPATAPAPEGSTRVQFTPSGDELSLEFATHQSAGAVFFQQGSGSQASVEVLRGAGEVDVLVLPDGVQVHNAVAATAEYRIVVPSIVRALRVRIGNGVPVSLSAEQIRSGRRIELRSGNR